MEEKDALLPNTTLSQYRIVSKIGEGGMGRVYLAHDTKLGRKAAIFFAQLGEKDHAFAELDKAVENREYTVRFLVV